MRSRAWRPDRTAGDDQHGVVGLVVGAVERLQAFDGTFSMSERAPMVELP
jgi:hypothetical protein